MITSPQNPRIKLARALGGRPKERHEAGAFLAEGVRLVEEALASGWPFGFVLFEDGLGERGLQLIGKLEDKQIEVEKVEGALLRSLSETETPQGILAVLRDFRLQIPAVPDLVLIPDSVRDPGNLGTLLRSADAAGVQAVFIPPETTDAFAPKVIRAGMGAHFRVPIQAVSWEEIRTAIRGLQIYLADMHGPTCWETDLRPPLALIVGGEAEGASAAAKELTNQVVSIPMSGRTESLNAAVAGSILMFEVRRQRNQLQG